MPHKKLLKEVMTSLCISSIAAFHLLAKSFTSGSTSATVIGLSGLDVDSSAEKLHTIKPVLKNGTHIRCYNVVRFFILTGSGFYKLD